MGIFNNWGSWSTHKDNVEIEIKGQVWICVIMERRHQKNGTYQYKTIKKYPKVTEPFNTGD